HQPAEQWSNWKIRGSLPCKAHLFRCFVVYDWPKFIKQGNHMSYASSQFVPLNVAVLTVSDTRTPETDTSGQYLFEQLKDAGHNVVERLILKDNLYQIRAQVANWIASDTVQVVLITGGTGFTDRDSTPEAV